MPRRISGHVLTAAAAWRWPKAVPSVTSVVSVNAAEGELMSKETSQRVASKASRILTDPQSSASEKSAAASALTQWKSQVEETSARVASQASKVLRDPAASARAKAAAASALSQRARGK
jgi:hypothetical protein